jgi:hypothetical protein
MEELDSMLRDLSGRTGNAVAHCGRPESGSAPGSARPAGPTKDYAVP